MTNFGNNPWVPGIVTDVFVPDQLIAGDLKIVTDTVTIGGSGVYERGTVMGKITATGVWIPSVKTATDGSEKPRGVLVDQVDNSVTSPQTGGVYVVAELNFNSLIYGSSWGTAGSAAALAALKVGFESTSIFLKTPISAN